MQNVLRGRLILGIKHQRTDRQIWNGRFVVQGHKNIAKSFLVHEISVPHQQSIKMLLRIDAIFEFIVFSIDVLQAYFQSAETLQLETFIKPRMDVKLDPDQLLQFFKTKLLPI